MKRRPIPVDKLAFPEDLSEWGSWQRSTQRLRIARHEISRVTRRMGNQETMESSAHLYLASRGSAPRVLFAVDAATPTQMASVLLPLTHLENMDLAVLAVGDPSTALQRLGLDAEEWQVEIIHPHAPLPKVMESVGVVIGVGNYLAAGALAYQWSVALHADFVVVQHGLLTPFAPPLPSGAHLAAFSADDAAFYLSGRGDLTYEVVGSQLLWSARREAHEMGHEAPSARAVFLGQLHGAELPRSDFARAAAEFCAVSGASYRPHPGETDKLSRLLHALGQRAGIHIDRMQEPLHKLGAPVASVFSTGVLETAARGLPARVTHPSPPPWLEAFWHRYEMVRWDGTAYGAVAPAHEVAATPAPEVPLTEPAVAVAGILRRIVSGRLGGDR